MECCFFEGEICFGPNMVWILLFHWQALCPRSTEQEIQAIITTMIDFYAHENEVGD